MRVYVVITSVDPLTAYLYDDGLARFCTQHYQPPAGENLEEVPPGHGEVLCREAGVAGERARSS